jgi:hypothetical protein
MGYDFACELRRDHVTADLIIANNVMAHVPNLDDFLSGIELLLDERGVFTVEFPNAENLFHLNQFDTIYHEHFSYFTPESATDALRRRGLEVFRTEQLAVHGGSIRLHAKHATDQSWRSGARDSTAPSCPEWAFQYSGTPALYKNRFIDLLLQWSKQGKRVVGYGAAAKANTMLNYCGIGPDLIQYVVDSTPDKVGKYLPGSRIPIHGVPDLEVDQPDVIIILAWNWAKQIAAKLQDHKDRGATIISRLEEL